MNHTGDPVRLGFFGSTGSTSVAIGLFYPGTNSTYPFAATDFLYITSLHATGTTSTGAAPINGLIASLLSVAAGASTATSSTVLAAIASASISFTDVGSEALSGPQGVIPSILPNTLNTSASTYTLSLTGCGFVVHSPGTTRPSFLNSQQPTG